MKKSDRGRAAFQRYLWDIPDVLLRHQLSGAPLSEDQLGAFLRSRLKAHQKFKAQPAGAPAPAVPGLPRGV